MNFFKPLTLSIVCAGLVSACATQHSDNAHYIPGLGEIMAQTSGRHIKLWYAGSALNWKLAAYELDELQEGFDEAEQFHPMHKNIKQPLATLFNSYMHPPLQQLKIAIADQDETNFKNAYVDLTTACNACHQQTEFGYNKIKQPNNNPYANQEF